MQREWILELDSPALKHIKGQRDALLFVKELGFSQLLFSGEERGEFDLELLPFFQEISLKPLMKVSYEKGGDLSLPRGVGGYVQLILQKRRLPTPFDPTQGEETIALLKELEKGVEGPFIVELPSGSGAIVREEAPERAVILEREESLHPFATRPYAACRLELAPHRMGRGVWPLFSSKKFLEMKRVQEDRRIRSLLITVASIPQREALLGLLLQSLLQRGDLMLLKEWEPPLLEEAAHLAHLVIETPIVDDERARALWELASGSLRLLKLKAKRGGLFAKVLPYFERDLLRHILFEVQQRKLLPNLGLPPAGESPLYKQEMKGGGLVKSSLVERLPKAHFAYEDADLVNFLKGANSLLQSSS